MYLKKIRRFYLSRIIFTILFLVISTYTWFNLKDFAVYKESSKNSVFVSSNVTFKSLKKVSDNETDNLNSYQFTVQNKENRKQTIKLSIVPDTLKECVSNNYIKYSINDGTVYSLNMDGVIYIDNIDEFEEKDINLKVWISDSYSGNFNYEGRLIIS